MSNPIGATTVAPSDQPIPAVISDDSAPVPFSLTAAAHQALVPHTAEVARALQHIDAMRTSDSSPAAIAFVDYVESLVLRTSDPDAVFALVLDCIKSVKDRG